MKKTFIMQGTKRDDLTYYEVDEREFDPIKCPKGHDLAKHEFHKSVSYWDDKTKEWVSHDMYPDRVEFYCKICDEVFEYYTTLTVNE